jgi:adenylate kinase
MALYVILMGVQGAGKGEQAKFISQTYAGIPQVSTGDLFRAMKTRTDPLAQRIQQIMAEGRLIDDDTTNEVVAERLSQEDAKHGVILDGYPRTPDQAKFLEQYLADKGEKVAAVVLLELDLFVAFKRAFGRVKAANGAVYNIYYQNADLTYLQEAHPEQAYPPRIVATLTTTGEVLQRRHDDADAAAVIKRIDTYLETTAPLIAFYDTKRLVRRINAEQSIEAVSADIKRVLDAVK